MPDPEVLDARGPNCSPKSANLHWFRLEYERQTKNIKRRVANAAHGRQHLCASLGCGFHARLSERLAVLSIASLNLCLRVGLTF